MDRQTTLLVLGGTGQTGRHLIRLALEQGFRVRALARTPAKLTATHPDLEVIRGSITEELDLDALVAGADHVISMLGDATAQRTRPVNTEFVRRLVPAMRRNGVDRFLYQAGGLSAAPDRPLTAPLRLIRATIARGFEGQHRDNEAVMRYLVDEAGDVGWMVHRAGIGGDGPSKGVLRRSSTAFSIGTFADCAAYDLRLVMDPAAVHTSDFSSYRAGAAP
ncbi:NAD(P)-dependent oxidoreductase [Clavibacter sp. VKM Ac-2873]|uniref:NAD(P)-dependent oxidoreductase n=1 Tax=Clavibacter sp. VKM Ac-2873 TaxID=2783813 RepID=UPI00351C9E1C